MSVPYQGGPPPGQPPWSPPPDHAQATTVLVLGILGLVLCGVIAPFAWSMGNRAQRDIDAAQGRLGGGGMVQAGRIMGIIGTVLLAVGVLFGLVVVAALGLGGLASTS